MATVERFEDLKVWQKSRELCKRLYSLSAHGSFGRDKSLGYQINKAAGSIMDNIAEGFGRRSRKEFTHFLTIAAGSAREVSSQLYRAEDCEYITTETCAELQKSITEIMKMLNKLITYLKATNINTADK